MPWSWVLIGQPTLCEMGQVDEIQEYSETYVERTRSLFPQQEEMLYQHNF